MFLRKGLIICVSAFIFLSAAIGLAQDPESSLNLPQWLWGEVVSVEGNQLTVKTLDIETDTEKELIISVDEKTTYENAASLSQISPKDNVSIDYITSPDGKNIARTISLAKAELSEAADSEALPQMRDVSRPPSAPSVQEKEPARQTGK